MGTKEPREARKLKRDRCPYAWHWDERKKKCQPDHVHVDPNYSFFVCLWSPEGLEIKESLK